MSLNERLELLDDSSGLLLGEVRVDDVTLLRSSQLLLPWFAPPSGLLAPDFFGSKDSLRIYADHNIISDFPRLYLLFLQSLH